MDVSLLEMLSRCKLDAHVAETNRHITETVCRGDKGGFGMGDRGTSASTKLVQKTRECTLRSLVNKAEDALGFFKEHVLRQGSLLCFCVRNGIIAFYLLRPFWTWIGVHMTAAWSAFVKRVHCFCWQVSVTSVCSCKIGESACTNPTH